MEKQHEVFILRGSLLLRCASACGDGCDDRFKAERSVTKDSGDGEGIRDVASVFRPTLAGEEGLEPPNARTKTWCLTTWLLPISENYN